MRVSPLRWHLLTYALDFAMSEEPCVVMSYRPIAVGANVATAGSRQGACIQRQKAVGSSSRRRLAFPSGKNWPDGQCYNTAPRGLGVSQSNTTCTPSRGTD